MPIVFFSVYIIFVKYPDSAYNKHEQRSQVEHHRSDDWPEWKAADSYAYSIDPNVQKTSKYYVVKTSYEWFVCQIAAFQNEMNSNNNIRLWIKSSNRYYYHNHEKSRKKSYIWNSNQKWKKTSENFLDKNYLVNLRENCSVPFRSLDKELLYVMAFIRLGKIEKNWKSFRFYGLQFYQSIEILSPVDRASNLAKILFWSKI